MEASKRMILSALFVDPDLYTRVPAQNSQIEGLSGKQRSKLKPANKVLNLKKPKPEKKKKNEKIEQLGFRANLSSGGRRHGPAEEFQLNWKCCLGFRAFGGLDFRRLRGSQGLGLPPSTRALLA